MSSLVRLPLGRVRINVQDYRMGSPEDMLGRHSLRLRIGLLVAMACASALAVGVFCGLLGLNQYGGYRHAIERHPGVLSVGFLLAVTLTILSILRLTRRFAGSIRQSSDVLQRAISSANYSVRLPSSSADELGRLNEALNQLLAVCESREAAMRDLQQRLEWIGVELRKAESEQERLSRELMETSRQAGMAEVATGVLHNVGNVLNSINVSATIVHNRLRASRVSNLGKALALLREHRADLARFLVDDPKGKMLPGYLETLTDHLAAEQAEVTREMDSLGKNVEHTKEIVAMQQNYARLCGVTETLQIAELVQDAIRMNLGAFDRHGVTIVQEFAEVPSLTVDKHKVLQILINLMRNAKYAMDELGPSEKRLTIGIASQGSAQVIISIKDNGIGIAPETLPRIFSHGFTTKRDGHGFGLHSGALAAKEMGGRLTAASEGLGKGAVFTLELPVTQPETTAHANRNRTVADTAPT